VFLTVTVVATHSRSTMFSFHSGLRTLAWSAIAISAVYAEEVIDALTFGHKVGSIVPDQHSVAGWTILGEQYTPELLSDRVILTPPYPGNKRGALWAQGGIQRTEWKAELFFRASGPDRASANIQLWYVKDGLQSVGTASLYTVPRFDGLAISIDQYGGRGGMIRGFLNDGSTPYQGSSNVDTFSFGQCQYSYRNQGRFSLLTLEQTATQFEVKIDQISCFKSEKVNLKPS
jgi:lectin, mannose-binding 1